MPLGIDLVRFFMDFGTKKPSQVGSKIYSKIDIILKRPKSLNILENQYNFQKNSSFWCRKIEEKSKNNRPKNEAKMGIALGIAFSCIFTDFWRQVGAKLAIKIGKKSVQKGIKHMMQTKKAS